MVISRKDINMGASRQIIYNFVLDQIKHKLIKKTSIGRTLKMRNLVGANAYVLCLRNAWTPTKSTSYKLVESGYGGNIIFNRGCASSSQEVRVRFAPSPTGDLHLGGLRSALYNHLFARSHGGAFILRIEDTDQKRSVAGSVERLCAMLRWAGVRVDEGPEQGGPLGPYVQSHRKQLYQEHIGKLIQSGHAYPCFCTKKRLELLRKEAVRQREVPRYDNRCRELTQEEVDEKMASDLPYVVRLKLHPGAEKWTDLVYGPMSIASENEGDPIMMKADGFPTYHFANVVDDHTMRISHVLRGVEWQISTPKHLLLYEAFGWTPPQFAHLPLLLNVSGKKLSKRQQSINVQYLKDEGYLPEVLQSFMCSMGSGFTKTQKELLEMEAKDLHKYFDLSRMKTNGTRLDFARLDQINKDHIHDSVQNPDKQKYMVEQVRMMVNEFFKDRPNDIEESSLEEDFILKVLNWTADDKRITVLKDLVTMEDFSYLWLKSSLAEQIFRDQDAFKPHTPTELLNISLLFAENIEESSISTKSYIKQSYKDLVTTHNLHKKPFLECMRYVLTGKKTGPPVDEIIAVLGKHRSVHRIKTMLSLITEPTTNS